MLIYGKVARVAAVHQMKRNGEDFLKEASNLAPIDEGELIGSGTTRTNDQGQMIVTEVGFNKPYATRTHYEMVPAPAAKMQPGPKTSAKSGTEFGAAGGLYLQRPLLGKAKRWSKAVADAVKKATGG